jgi:hypothetical protein
MSDILDDDFVANPPSAERIAERALVLAAVSCRASIESDSKKKGAEELRNQILPWLAEVGASRELEPEESAFISVPLGGLDHKRALDASWESEAMVVLAWILQCSELPKVHIQCDPPAVADGLGFLCSRQETALYLPSLREEKEIEAKRNTYLTLHWRLRQYSQDHLTMDFRKYVSNCKWADMRLDDLELLDGDLAIEGVSIGKTRYERYREVLSITQTRHQAFNWLLGFEPVYSQVTTDT